MSSADFAIHFVEQPEAGFSGTGRIAYRHTPAKTSEQGEIATNPGVLFCGGFHSNMDGGKAQFLHGRCAAEGIGFTRFDYRGHGLSDCAFADGTIGDWAVDARLVLDQVCEGPHVIVGSSMGAWIALLLAKARPERVAGLVLVAPAPDFPQRLMVPALPEEAHIALERDGVWYRPSEFEEDPYPITKRLLEESKAQEILDGPAISVDGPIHILHGTEDEVVPLSHAVLLQDWLARPDSVLEVIEGGDHRLSEPENLECLWQAVRRCT